MLLILPFFLPVFEEQCFEEQCSKILKIIGKSYILTVKNSHNWKFLIFFVFTNVFPLELETRLPQYFFQLHSFLFTYFFYHETKLCRKYVPIVYCYICGKHICKKHFLQLKVCVRYFLSNFYFFIN